MAHTLNDRAVSVTIIVTSNLKRNPTRFMLRMTHDQRERTILQMTIHLYCLKIHISALSTHFPLSSSYPSPLNSHFPNQFLWLARTDPDTHRLQGAQPIGTLSLILNALSQNDLMAI